MWWCILKAVKHGKSDYNLKNFLGVGRETGVEENEIVKLLFWSFLGEG